MSRGFTSTMTWFHVESITYPSTEGSPLQGVPSVFMLNFSKLLCFPHETVVGKPRSGVRYATFGALTRDGIREIARKLHPFGNVIPL